MSSPNRELIIILLRYESIIGLALETKHGLICRKRNILTTRETDEFCNMLGYSSLFQRRKQRITAEVTMTLKVNYLLIVISDVSLRNT